MRIKTVLTSLVLMLITFSNAPTIFAKQLKVINLAPVDGGASVATIQLDDLCLLADFDNTTAILLKDDSVYTINRTDNSYRVQTYAELTAAARKAADSAQPRGSAAKGVELQLTGVTARIAGFRAHKLVRMNNGQPEGEFWVSADLMPARLRMYSQNLRNTLPKDYWTRIRGNPGMVEIVMMFGVPLKIVTNDHKTYQATVVSKPVTRSVFEIPAGYTKLDSSTGKQ